MVRDVKLRSDEPRMNMSRMDERPLIINADGNWKKVDITASDAAGKHEAAAAHEFATKHGADLIQVRTTS